MANTTLMITTGASLQRDERTVRIMRIIKEERKNWYGPFFGRHQLPRRKLAPYSLLKYYLARVGGVKFGEKSLIYCL
ncbi:MAG TPA: hypothetical protein PKZ52_01905 [Cellvibrionaceae bacterium]|nr:hypothetical protein [Cellvibrionaceae bacterium]